MKNDGMTLIELMVAIAVLIIGVALAVPSFTTLNKNNRLNAASNGLVRMLQLARSEAIKRNTPVTVCRSSDQSQCKTGSWTQGWIVFIDDGATTGTVENGETILGSQDALSPIIQVTTSSNFSDSITFLASGQPAQTGNLKFCDDRTGTHGRNIYINGTGRIRLATGEDCP